MKWSCYSYFNLTLALAWHAQVSEAKRVSHCEKCNLAWEALLPEQEYGGGRFECPNYRTLENEIGRPEKKFCKNIWFGGTKKNPINRQTQRRCNICGTMSVPIAMAYVYTFFASHVCGSSARALAVDLCLSVHISFVFSAGRIYK